MVKKTPTCQSYYLNCIQCFQLLRTRAWTINSKYRKQDCNVSNSNLYLPSGTCLRGSYAEIRYLCRTIVWHRVKCSASKIHSSRLIINNIVKDKNYITMRICEEHYYLNPFYLTDFGLTYSTLRLLKKYIVEYTRNNLH